MHEVMTVAIQMYGPDAIPWSQHERPDGDPDDLDPGDREDWPDPVPAPVPVHPGMPTTEDAPGDVPF